MEYTNGEDRILYIKYLGSWLPVGCLTGNSISESSLMLPTTTRDNNGWDTSRPSSQSYSISFEGVQINTTVAGGTFTVASYDRLKQLKRSRLLLDWKIQGTIFPIVDYGKCYITELSETSNVGEYLSFSGSITGYGIPLTRSLGEFVLNDGDPEVVITTNEDANFIIRTKDAN
jgi:hypothetical protein